jgi:hypothetical protein
VYDNVQTLYNSKLSMPKADISFDQITKSLEAVPDGEIFAMVSTLGSNLMHAPVTTPENVYTKRPTPQMYEIAKYEWPHFGFLGCRS